MTNYRDSTLFDEWATSYDTDVERTNRFPFLGYSAVLAAMTGAAMALNPECIIDLGTGTANLLTQLKQALPNTELWGVDFSADMLAQATQKLPAAILVQADITDTSALHDIPPADIITAAYVLHEFSDETKARIIYDWMTHQLSPIGSLLIGDISFPDSEQRIIARTKVGRAWDDDEYYFAADPFLALLREQGIDGNYTQISPCAGVYVLRWS